MSQTMTFYDLRDALAQPGCAVCRLIAESTERFLDSLLWENVNDPEVRREIRQARGFCHEHGWALAHAGASLRQSFETLMDAQRAIWERLADQLSESIRKSDHRYLGETWGEEKGAWLRAIAALVGARPDDSLAKN